MIKANELRIGNFVKFNAFTLNQRMQIDEIDFEDILGGYFTDIEPIPLTEDWLVKLGFEKRKDKTPKIALDIVCVWNKKQFFFFYESKNNFIAIDFLNSDDFGTKTTEIQYVHQLQNLYFALTGQELEMKGGQNG